MGFNLFSAITGAAQGLAMSGGNPIGAIAGGVGGALSGGGPSGVGNISASNNPTLAIQQGMDQADEYDQLALNAENISHNEQMQWQSTAFNELMDEKSEQMREMNLLRDVSMAQRKADNSIVKEFIQTIKD
jgi:hypothetical protein